MKYSMTCSCGDVMSIDAGSREDAVSKMKKMMDASAIAKHMADKHPGEPVPSVSDIHKQIDSDLKPM